MSRQSLRFHLAAIVIGSGLAIASPSLAQQVDDMGPPPPSGAPYAGEPVAVPPPPVLPAPGPAQVISVEPRVREAWLAECHRRMHHYYMGDRRRHRHNDHDMMAPDSTYCEAYFDDYYRYYSQAALARPAPAVTPPQRCEEVVTTEEVPVRSRSIPRRHRPHDKRIRIAP